MHADTIISVSNYHKMCNYTRRGVVCGNVSHLSSERNLFMIFLFLQNTLLLLHRYKGIIVTFELLRNNKIVFAIQLRQLHITI